MQQNFLQLTLFKFLATSSSPEANAPSMGPLSPSSPLIEKMRKNIIFTPNYSSSSSQRP